MPSDSGSTGTPLAQPDRTIARNRFHAIDYPARLNIGRVPARWLRISVARRARIPLGIRGRCCRIWNPVHR